MNARPSPDCFALALRRGDDLRQRIEEAIGRLIAFLDAIDGDENLEPDLADTADDREEENEHGGDVLDEPHDDQEQGDREPSLGWPETCGLRGI